MVTQPKAVLLIKKFKILKHSINTPPRLKFLEQRLHELVTYVHFSGPIFVYEID